MQSTGTCRQPCETGDCHDDSTAEYEGVQHCLKHHLMWRIRLANTLEQFIAIEGELPALAEPHRGIVRMQFEKWLAILLNEAGEEAAADR